MTTIYPNSIGKFAEGGGIETEAENCAVTGIPVRLEHHVVQRLGDGAHFVRVVSDQYHRLTQQAQDDLLASVTPNKSPSRQSSKAANDAAKDASDGN